MAVDICLFTETKLTNGIHTRSCLGYSVAATRAVSPHQGGVALIYKDSAYWQIESLRKHGPNVISCELVSGFQRRPLVGAYIPPSGNYRLTLAAIDQAMDRFTPEERLRAILLGDLNVNLASPQGARAVEIATALDTHGLEDLVPHFYQRSRFGYGTTWRQCRNGQWINSRCDYILGTDRRIWQNVSIRDPRNFDSDHYMVIGKLLSAPMTGNRRYLLGRRRFPLKLPKWGPQSRADALFQALQEMKTPPQRVNRLKKPWVSEATWKLVDQKAALRHRRQVGHDRELQSESRRLSRRIQQALKADRKQRVETAGAAIEAALSANDLQGAWTQCKAWYREASDRAPK
ncbi:MAG TPA: endonuclease/exonuclease/phosphatase family protein, partial [Candidatus Obscuribacterales bacterium]